MKYELGLTNISKHDRFFCYAWECQELYPNATKFGDKWVFAGEDAYKACADRVRESLGVLKHAFDSGKVKIHAIWDVSEYAEKKDKFKIHGKIDTTIGDEIGLRIKDDLYNRPADELVCKVNDILIKAGQPLPKCGLTVWQYRAVVETIAAFEEGKRTILSDMCARAGKTLYVGALTVEADIDLLVFASYVLTSFTSVINDLKSFSQFKDIELIDSQDADYKKRIENARKNNKQVIVFLSLCKGGLKENKRDERIKYLFNIDAKRMLVIDEADYGAWKAGQCDPLIKHRKDDDYVVIMTGTNADRAVGGWDVDGVVQVTYLEMLMEKKNAA